MSNDEQIKEVELSIDMAKEAINKKKDFDKLLLLPEFNSIIEDGYFKVKASELVLLLASPGMQADTHQKELLKQINAIGSLRQYFHSIVAQGMQAESALEDFEATQTELLEEV